MNALASQAGLAVIVFVSTNTDDIFVLIGFFADPKFSTRQVVAGQYLGIAILYTVSVFGSQISLIVPPTYVGLLGLAPIIIGGKKLWDLRRQGETGRHWENHTAARGRGVAGKVLTVAAVTIANGGDNIGVYTPLFATRMADHVGVFGIVFLMMTALWCFVACWMVRHRSLGAPVRHYSHWILPFILIALGMLILYKALA